MQPKTDMQPKTSRFEKGDEKKHSVIYVCRDRDAIAVSVYISKSALPRPFPATLDLTLSFPQSE